MTRNRTRISAIPVLLACCLAVGCGGGEEGNAATDPDPGGTSIGDAPADDVTRVADRDVNLEWADAKPEEEPLPTDGSEWDIVPPAPIPDTPADTPKPEPTIREIPD